MTTDLVMMKQPDGSLVPCDAQGEELLGKLKVGAGVTVRITRHNNPQFHRKLMKLFAFAYDCFTPQAQTYQDIVVEKNFDRFRKDLTILAGFYETGISLSGKVVFEAKSLSFANMGQEEREQVYTKIIDVILAKVLTQYTRSDLDAVIAELMGYDR